MKKQTKRRAAVAAIAFGLFAAGVPALADDTVNVSLLIDHTWLENHLEDPDLRILDYRKTGLVYRLGHIPGARYIPRRAAYDTVDKVKGMLPSMQTLAEYLSKAGVLPHHRVVIYDSSDGLWAARLFWALEVIGHERVHILDGGYREWKQESGATTRSVPEYSQSPYTPDPRPQLVADTNWMLEHLDDTGVQIIDSRSADEFSGDDRQAKRAGHIPGAVSIDWVSNLVSGEGSRFLRPEALRSVYTSRSIDDRVTIVAHCQTGVRASHTYFALRLLGYTDLKVYDGSWEVWGNRSDTPIVTGG